LVDAVDYTWVREYHYEPQQQDAFKDQMVFFFTDGMVTYMPFTHKLAMQKHKSRGTQGDGAAQTPVDFGRPSSVSVKKRKFTDDEAAERCAPNPPPPRTPHEKLTIDTHLTHRTTLCVRDALRGKPCNSRAKLIGESLKAETKTQWVETSLLTLQNPHTHTNTYARTLTNQHGSHRQCRPNDATELAHADMTTLPKVDTNCTALSLMPTVNGNTFAASLRTDTSP
jgi:hypothetical protein